MNSFIAVCDVMQIKEKTMSGIAIIPTIVAIWLGNLLSKHIKQSTFLKIIYIVLIVSGIVLLISNL